MALEQPLSIALPCRRERFRPLPSGVVSVGVGHAIQGSWAGSGGGEGVPGAGPMSNMLAVCMVMVMCLRCGVSVRMKRTARVSPSRELLVFDIERWAPPGVDRDDPRRPARAPGAVGAARAPGGVR